MANEILRLPDSVSLVFVDNLPVILAERIRWYADKAFRRGGTGRSRKVGLKGMVVAVVACTCSLLTTGVVFSLPALPARQQSDSPIHTLLNPEPTRMFEYPPVTVPRPAYPAYQPPPYQPAPPARRRTTAPLSNRGWRQTYP